MKLSFANFPIEYTDELGNDELGGLKVIRECGFTCTDFNITQAHIGEDLVARAELLKAELLECGMTAPQAHAPIINPFDPEKTDAIPSYERSLRFCQIVGIPTCVVHAGSIKGNTREEYYENNVAFYRSLIPVAEETGVMILVENIGHAGDDRRGIFAAGAPAWDANTVYSYPDVVAYTDGNTYRCIGRNVPAGTIPAHSPESWVRISVLGGDDFFDIDVDGGLMPGLNPTFAYDWQLDANGDIMPWAAY